MKLNIFRTGFGHQMIHLKHENGKYFQLNIEIKTSKRQQNVIIIASHIASTNHTVIFHLYDNQ